MHRSVLLVLALLPMPLGFPSAVGAEPAELDLRQWEHVPVFYRGRLVPLDTLARAVVEKICGRVSPTIDPAGALAEGQDISALAAPVRQVFPDGKPRKFAAAELLLAWLVEPERWEHVPFLHAEHEQLRRELLELPVTGPGGSRLKYVSPLQLLNATKFRMRLGDLGDRQRQAETEGKQVEPRGVDKRVQDLFEAYSLFRLLTFNPAAPMDGRNHFMKKLAAAVHAWGQLEPELALLQRASAKEAANASAEKQSRDAPVVQASESVRALLALSEKGDLPLAEAEASVASFRRAMRALAGQTEDLVKKISLRPPPAGEDQIKRMRRHLEILAARSAELVRLSTEAHLALYDNGEPLRVVPALTPTALEADRDPKDDSQPWLNLQTLICGSDDVLQGYPPVPVRAVRAAFAGVRDAYVSRSDPRRAERFATAMERFVAEVRTLAEAIEPLRRQLPLRSPDEAAMAKTAYPPAGFTDAEVEYNQHDPFFWSWVVSLGAMICFSLSFGLARKPMFWLGVLVLIVAQVMIGYGFALRVYITGWAPVTNMFETVVFMALVVALLGLWFTLLPLVWPGLRLAWQWTAAPLTWETAKAESETGSASLDPRRRYGPWLLLVPRVALMFGVFLVLAVQSHGAGGESKVINLLPQADVGASMPNFNDWLTWLVGMCVLVASMWYVPRALLAALLGLGTIPATLRQQGLAEPLGHVFLRKPYAVVGAIVAFVASLVAYYSPVFHKDMSPLMPVLRSNFWLLLHVLSITASYGAGALAWGLGNIALGYYLFGRYRAPAGSGEVSLPKGHRPAGDYRVPADALRRRPPEDCAALGGFIYKATQVAVLLLAIGTILGALWADVAWGRFWGWDPKEVWSLIAILVYMVILHGRYAGWFGHFGMAMGAVLAFIAIIMTWYGVNYLLPGGLHSYGEVAGGQMYVLAAILANLVFVGAAALRYFGEISSRNPPPQA